ncbi:hypothetical protein VB834_06390 [Limnoraphis robusta Tam1]|jgi:hypothetical protein|uniref:Uncharacterized protein n=1 Tax=Limnoraphis robusta CCNP1315 TaxID=3110306 RepID=A0ABU5TUN6_9CYAN|nr:hypothetical protein [Limnoraphis robusta]MCG5057934.1 hypothetical protein [Limnoraphis sp. WC205]MEA5499809.1 hypothetical protein [Limnoraphis robusta BA-68 BA1]MEA5518612.1 hypothetical protein [Limnoraphis robusta CCNP1315]MEA5538658.1 hypothetical protein [Limnoraphis robusta Tam1]MEA5547993.1 hypothetical protein [Limnoraphis robusta CCNP1324]
MTTKKSAFAATMNHIKSQGYNPEAMSVEHSYDPDSANYYLTLTPNNELEKRIDCTIDEYGNVAYWGVRIIPAEIMPTVKMSLN